MLKLVADSLAEIPESLRPNAKEQNNIYTVTDFGRHQLIDDTALRSALVDERQARKKLSQMLAGYGVHVSEDGTKVTAGPDGSIDPEEARKALALVRDGKVGAKTPEEIEGLRKQLTEKFETDRRKLTEERQQLEAYVAKQLIEREALATIKAVGGTDSTVSLLMPTILQRTRVERTPDGTPRAVVVDEQGRQVISRKYGSAEPMGVPEYISTLQNDKLYAAAFPIAAAGGSGSSHSAGRSAPGGANVDPSTLTGTQLLERAHRK